MFEILFSIDTWLSFLSSPLGVSLFVPIYAIWVTILLPGAWASMLAGALYGTLQGSILVFLGASLGAQISFFLSRTLLKGFVQKKLAGLPKLQAIEKAMTRESLKLVLLTRLSPAFPFSLLNFMFGVSQVSWRDYSIGLIAILPGTILFCGLGALAGDLARFNEIISGNTNVGISVLRIFGLVATFAVIFIVSRSARSALKEFEPVD